MELAIIGRSTGRVDVLEKVIGKAIYCDDIKLPGMLHAKVLRSPYPHAKIVSTNTSKAEQLPGVRCVVTGKDAPENKYGVTVLDQPIIAKDLVRYKGEPVAAVAADSIDIAEEALELIEVEYEELKGLFDPEEAMNINPSVIIHPELPNYSKAAGEYRPSFVPDRPNVHFYYRLRKGDVEKGFKEADLIIENRYTAATVQHCPIEPHAAIAQVDYDGSLTVYAGRQGLYRAKSQLSNLFGISLSKIRVISPYVGGGFGNKLVLVPTVEVAFLALRTRRPVKLVYTREEIFTSTSVRGSMVVNIKDGVKKDGTLVAREMQAIINSGAYSQSSGVCALSCSSGALATYRIPNVKADSYAVYTNEPVCGALRGLHAHLPIMASECQIDIIAKKLCISPIEIRRKNFLREKEENFCGEIVHSIGANSCLDQVTESIRLEERSREKGPWRIGKGVAVANHFTLPGSSTAVVKVLGDGIIEVFQSADEMGQGCNTVMAQIAAEEFGVSLDSVKVVSPDTAITPYNPGSIGSHTTFDTGNAVRLACQDAKQQLFKLAAEELGVLPQDLYTKNGRIYVKGVSDKVLMISSLFRLGAYVPHGAEIIGKAAFIQEAAPRNHETGQIERDLAQAGKRWMSFFTYGAQFIEVAVNIETGVVKILKISSTFDMGQAINPKMCEQQIEGGIGMGIGTSLFEEMKVDKGVVLNPNFTDYRIPTIKEIPLLENLKSGISSAFHKDGPFGAKGLGEGVMMPTPPAIANAIFDAIGVMMTDIPITPEKILQALKRKVH